MVILHGVGSKGHIHGKKNLNNILTVFTQNLNAGFRNVAKDMYEVKKRKEYKNRYKLFTLGYERSWNPVILLMLMELDSGVDRYPWQPVIIYNPHRAAKIGLVKVVHATAERGQGHKVLNAALSDESIKSSKLNHVSYTPDLDTGALIKYVLLHRKKMRSQFNRTCHC